MKVYKVCAVVDGEWRSSRCYDAQSAYVVYELGKKAVPKIEGSCLMAFKSEEQAKQFLDLYRSVFSRLNDVGPYPSGYVVLRCEGEKYRGSHVVFTGVDDRDSFPRRWKRLLEGHVDVFTVKVDRKKSWPLPYDTVLCESITPLEVVYEWSNG